MSLSHLIPRFVRPSLLGLAMILVGLSGCQSWWNRSNSQSLLGFTNEAQDKNTDDWEHPNAPGDRDRKIAPLYKPSTTAMRSENKPDTQTEKPVRVTLPRDRQKDNDSPSNPGSDLAKLPAGQTEPPASSKPVVPATASVPVAKAPEGIPDSGKSQVDIEGALTLLPADYQATLRKRIAGEPEEKLPETDPKDPSRWTHELNQSVVALEKLLEASTDMEPAMRMHHEMTLRLLYLAQRNLEQAKRPISDATPHEQEYLEHQLTALFHATSPDPIPSRPRHWALVASEDRHADRHLAALGSLQVSPPVFCTQVDGFGVTHKFDKNSFAPDQQVLLYCELENVTSQKVREGFETKIKGSYEIRDSQGKRIVEQALPMEPDLCSSQRRDFFLVYMIYMPQNVEPGKYELILTMEDLCGNKFGSSKTDFEIKKQ
ncbi:MAG: hypothetical protein ACKN85_16730 [Pirellula sp.]